MRVRSPMQFRRCTVAGSSSGRGDDLPTRMRAPARGAPSAGWTSKMDERDRTTGRSRRGDSNQWVRTGTKPFGNSGRTRTRRRRSGNARRVDGLLRRFVETRPTRP